MSRRRRVLIGGIAVVLVVVGAVALPRVRDRVEQNQDAEARLRLLRADPITALAFPGKGETSEYTTSGRPTGSGFGGQHRVEVTQEFSFSGDARETAVTILRTMRDAAWIASADCGVAPKAFFVRGKKSFGSFSGFVNIQVNSALGDRGRVVVLRLTAPFPGEDPTGTIPPQPKPTCLD